MSSRKKVNKPVVKKVAPVIRSMKAEARLQEFLDHAIGKHTDAYLKNMAMTVVQLKAFSEIATLQSDLLKEKAKIALQTEAIADSKVDIAQVKRQLTLEKKKIAEVRDSLLQAEKLVEKMKTPVPAEALEIKENLSRDGMYSSDEFIEKQVFPVKKHL